MSLMVQVAGHWVLGIEHWQDTLTQKWLRWGFEQQGLQTRLEQRRKAQGVQ